MLYIFYELFIFIINFIDVVDNVFYVIEQCHERLCMNYNFGCAMNGSGYSFDHHSLEE